MKKAPLLEVKHLKKVFPVYSGILRRQVGAVKAVDDISFTLQEGEVLGILGESGCGKSTAGRAILRLIEPSSGELYFAGNALHALSPSALLPLRRQMQIVFQNPHASLNPRKTVAESVGEALRFHGMASSLEEEREKAALTLEAVGISRQALSRYPHQFSGGQQQRICIARALALRPRLIVFDEAVSALDVSVQAQVLNLLHELKEQFQLSYLFISHDLAVVRHLCNRVVILYLGKVMESGSIDEVFTHPKHPYTQALLSAIPRSHPLEKKEPLVLRGEVPSPLHPPSGCPFHTRCPVAKPSCRTQAPPMQSLSSTHHYACVWE